MLELGMRGELRATVDFSMTAAAIGSGSVEVLSTPYMIGMMEMAAIRAISGGLEPGQASVGTVVNVRHLAATPIGFEVTARAQLLEIDGRRLVFGVEAFDQSEQVGEGRHERFLIDFDRFMARALAKQRSSAG